MFAKSELEPRFVFFGLEYLGKKTQAFNIPCWILDSFCQVSSLFNVLLDSLTEKRTRLILDFYLCHSKGTFFFFYISDLNIFFFLPRLKEFAFTTFGIIYIPCALLRVRLFNMNGNIC